MLKTILLALIVLVFVGCAKYKFPSEWGCNANGIDYIHYYNAESATITL